MNTLIKVLRRASNKKRKEGLLYLPEDESWTAKSPAMILDPDNMKEDKKDENDQPLIAGKKNLTETLCVRTIRDIVKVAKRDIEDPPSDELLVQAFIYYYCYDAFLPKESYNPETRQYDQDLVFYNALGDESESVPCKRAGCNRGKIEGSLLCRVHQRASE